MKNLYLLIKGLTTKEIVLVRNFLLANREGSDSKLLKLFNLILVLKELPEADFVSEKIYNKKSNNTFEKLCSRLNARILDTLISSTNTENSNLEHFDLMSINIRRKLAQFYQLYYSKGNYDLVTKELLDEIIAKSKQYELYSPLIEALQFKKVFLGFSKGYEEFQRINDEMIFYTKCLNAGYKAVNYYFQMTIHQNFGKTDQDLNIFLIKSIKELDFLFRETNSAFVGYYLKQLEIAYYSNKDDFEQCRQKCKEIINLLKKHKSIHLKRRIAFALDNLARFETILGEYENAIEKSREAQVYMGGDPINFLISIELEFYALFYSKNFKGAKNLVNIILSDGRIKQRDSFRYSKFIFYKANIEFKEGDNKEVLKILNQNLEISKDKLGWEIPLRILNIWCLIERGNLGIAEDQVEAFRKLIKRHTAKEIGKRNLIINKYLNNLAKNNFDFSKCNTAETIELLSSDQKNIKWTPLTPELIPFQDWLKTKI